MKIAVISDIHSNKVALEAVVADLPDVDRIVSAGDVVGYGPWPADCLEWVREREIPTVQGNHDRAVATGEYPSFNDMAAAGVEYAREQLSIDQREWLASLPTEQELFDGRLKVVHGHPDNPDHYTFPEEFGPGLLGDEDVLVLGHTHVQHAEQFTEGIVLNPGSVGQPRDSDPRAAYAVVDLDAMTFELRRVEYDVGEVLTAVRGTSLPRRVGTRLSRGQ
ncbi:YfcE family phosphodiesterase [Halorhabdus sp. CBA1104]|uniref:metallophosphoesterase family protein n=1 Tax=unclassified Halorhabdus TaxID=2621901 RepID=UPI0012B3E1B7|nr:MULTISPECIES: YfcE family phosphodiesterase [unclassified Halorhabdus]QGN07571.1 YfcE family phosphodiesterase [Halorhabdus sp. CBA1104]